MKFADLKLKTKIILTSCAPEALLVVLSVVSMQSLESLVRNNRWVDHTHRVIEKAMMIEAAAVDMETGMRGYLLAGKEEFLGPYSSGKERFHDLVNELAETVSDNPAQVELLGEVNKTIQEWLSDVTEPIIALRGEVGHAKTMDDMANLVGEARGKVYFDRFRELMATFVEREKKLMDVRNEEAERTAAAAEKTIVTGTAAVLLLALGITWLMGVVITKPVNRLVENLRDIAEGEGDLTARLPAGGKDEIGETARYFNLFVENIQMIIKGVSENAAKLSSSSTDLSDISRHMSSNSKGVSDRSGTVSAASEQMSGNMSSVAAAIEETSTNVSFVASAAEEMSATISEISQNTEKARAVAGKASTHADNSSVRVNELGRAADEIGKVTEAISEISEQTNLLALNATIEAARAGDAGKGFAVVAGEIKDLATQTADATTEIRQKIEGIQASTRLTVDEISQITNVIKDVNEMVGTIASAVEEQASTTREIAENITQASGGMGDVSENITQSASGAAEVTRDISDVNAAAGELADRSRQVNRSAEVLTGLSNDLTALVERFRT